MATIATEAVARRQLALSILISSALCGLAVIYGYTVVVDEIRTPWVPGEYADTHLLFLAQDRIVAPAFIGILSASIVFFWLGARDRSALGGAAFTIASWPVAALSAVAFVLAWAAAVWIHHSFDLSLDEFLTGFQARIFLDGKLLAELTPAEFDSSNQFQPLYVYRNEEHHLWAAGYRPVFSAFRALFGLFAGDRLLNPAFAALSIWAIWDISKRTFPDVPEAPLLSALLLLSSAQFLATAASGFAFSAHLGLNLLWLSLFLRGSFRDHCLAGAVGFLATGLHQVTFHPLFAAPFLCALLLGRFGPRTALIPYAVAYSLALPLWILWPEISVWLQTGDASVLPRSVSDIHYLRSYTGFVTANAAGLADRATALTLTNLFRYLLWLSPAVLPLSLLALMRIRKVSLVPILCAVSFAIAVVATHLLMPNQIHTWGSRYYHPVLGCTVILAVAGYVSLRDHVNLRTLQAGLGLMLIASAAILLPWRAAQIDAKVGPRARVQRAIEATDADYVVLTGRFWFGSDLIRNDPFLRNRPLITHTGLIRNEAALHGKKIVELSNSDLVRMGLPAGTLLEPVTEPQ